MTKHLGSGLGAGLAAGVIAFICFKFLADQTTSKALMTGLWFFLGTAVLTTLIATVIGNQARARHTDRL